MNRKLKRFFFVSLLLLPFFLGGCQGRSVDYSTKSFYPSAVNCWPCVMYMQTFRALNDTINGALDKVAQNSLIVLEISLLFWLLFKVGNIVFSIALPDMKKQLAPILIVLFKALIAIIFLTNTQFFYDVFGKMLIQPLGEAFLSLSMQLLASPTQIGVDRVILYSDDVMNEIRTLIVGWNNIVGSGTNHLNMFGDLPTRVIMVVYLIYSSLNNGLGLAYQLFAEGEWSATVSGFMLIIALYWLILMVPLFLVEAFIKMGMVLLLMPLFMVGWVFTFPKDVVKKVLHSLFSGFFDILFNCIYIAFFISLIRIYKFSDVFSTSSAITDERAKLEAMSMKTDYIILLALTFVMAVLSNHVQEFSNHFFEGSEKSNVLAVVRAIKDYAMKALKYALSAATLLSKATIDGAKKLAEKSKGDKE